MSFSDRPLNALLGKGAVYEGDLSFEGRVRLDGLFRGRIYTDEVLEIGPEGCVEGEVDAAVVILAGQLEGLLKVREHLLVQPTAHVRGTVQAARIEVKPGARFAATLQVGQEPAE